MDDRQKNKKEERIKQYFAETAKRMIISDGIKSVSVRKVADEAGYSLGTIYNHFTNLDELLWLTRNLMMQDIAEYIGKRDSKRIEDAQDIALLFQTYLNYFVENPNVYRFFFFHSLDMSQKKMPGLNQTPEFQQRFQPLVEYLMRSKNKTMDEVMMIIKAVIYAVHGLLTLYISGNDELTNEEVKSELNSIVAMLTES